MKYYCNPINVPYRYQFNRDYNDTSGALHIDREAADPSMICFKGIYYIFPSMTKGCWRSEDMANWEPMQALMHTDSLSNGQESSRSPENLMKQKSSTTGRY